MTTLEQKQAQMRARQKRKPRPGVKPRGIPDEVILKFRRRTTAYLMIERGLPFGLIADQINKAFGTSITSDAITKWYAEGCPLDG